MIHPVWFNLLNQNNHVSFVYSMLQFQINTKKQKRYGRNKWSFQKFWPSDDASWKSRGSPKLLQPCLRWGMHACNIFQSRSKWWPYWLLTAILHACCTRQTAVDHIFSSVFKPKPECKLLLYSYEFTNILTGVQMPLFSELSKALVFDIT